MDNCSIHHVDAIVNMVHEVGALVQVTYRTTTQLKKSFLRLRHIYSFEDPEYLVMAAFSTLTFENCQQWIWNAGIYNLQ